MEIKLIHAHFLISTGDYCNERIGFTVEPGEGESTTKIVKELREHAIGLIGPKAKDLYDEKWALQNSCKKLRLELAQLRDEWEKTAEFLKAQGINPTAPRMPQFNNLLASSNVEEESVSAEIFDEDGNPF